MDRRNYSTTLLVTTALITALTTIATMFFRIPVGTGYIHLGDAMIILAAMLLPKKHAIFAGSVGATLADLFGYAIWAPWTFAIKLVMVIVVQHAVERARDGKRSIGVSGAEFVAYAISAVWTAIGYYVAEGVIYGNWTAPMIGVPFNLLQVGVGAVIAVLVAKALAHTQIGNLAVKVK